MTKLDAQTIQTVASVLADSFLDDPLMLATFDGISGRREIVYRQGLLQARYFARSHEMHFADGDARAFLIGIDSRAENSLQETWLYWRIFLTTIAMLQLKEIKAGLANYGRIMSVLSFDWQKKFVTGAYYHIKIIAIARELRGSGAFRRLMTPVLASCDRNNLPAILETHNPANLPIYERFGFELVLTKESPKTDLKQYCMVRMPRQEPGGTG